MLKTANPEDYEALRSALIRARKDRNITQSQLAKTLGEHQQLVSKYETGERRLDIIEFLIVVRAIGCNVEEILKDTSFTD